MGNDEMRNLCIIYDMYMEKVVVNHQDCRCATAAMPQLRGREFQMEQTVGMLFLLEEDDEASRCTVNVIEHSWFVEHNKRLIDNGHEIFAA